MRSAGREIPQHVSPGSRRRLRVLLLAPHPFFQHRGTPIAERALLEVLSAQGHSVDVVTFPEGEAVDVPGCRIYRTPRLPGVRNVRPGFSLKKLLYDVLLFVRAGALARGGRYDVIHAVEESVFIAIVLGPLFRVPYVYDMDSSLPEQLTERFPLLGRVRWALGAMERLAVRRAAAVLTVCRSVEEVARRHAPDRLIARIEDTSMLGTGGDDGPVERIADRIGPDRGAIAMYVGNLEKYQGIDLLLEAFQRVAAEEVGAHLVVIGGDDARIRHYTGLAQRLGVERRVHFLGPRPLPQLGAYLRQADVLVSPRIAGTNTPMKIYSYLDSGRPVVATRLPAHTQVLDDEIACLVDPTPEDLAEGLVRLFRDAELRMLLARRARERFQREFGPEVFRERILRFYGQLEELLQPRGV